MSFDSFNMPLGICSTALANVSYGIVNNLCIVASYHVNINAVHSIAIIIYFEKLVN